MKMDRSRDERFLCAGVKKKILEQPLTQGFLSRCDGVVGGGRDDLSGFRIYNDSIRNCLGDLVKRFFCGLPFERNALRRNIGKISVQRDLEFR